jgi:hypothetical protein
LFISFISRYGGIYECGSREYTLDDFYALQLDKMEKYLCLKESDVVIPDGDVESSSNDEDKDSDDDGDDDEEEEEEKDRDNADIEQDVAGEEDIMENIVKSREDQPTETIEQQVT